MVLAQANVVAREIVAVLTKGTLSDPEMLTCQSEPNYILALFQDMAKAQSGMNLFGACLVDVATGQIVVGQWYGLLSPLRACQIRPMTQAR